MNNDISQPLVVAHKIYDSENYCAFTSLIKCNGKFYCAFREGKKHVGEGDYGVIRILSSKDGNVWSLEETVKDTLTDLRDPNLSVMPNGTLLLLCGARKKDNKGVYVSKTYFSVKKKGAFTALQPVLLPASVDSYYCAWCWRMTWHKKVGFTIEYRHDGKKQYAEILKTKDGKSFETVCSLDIPGMPSEGKIFFVGKKEMMALVRSQQNGYVGFSKYPYVEWEWRELPFFIGGHDILMLDTIIVAASRWQSPEGNRTCVYYGSGNQWFTNRIQLPSGGDTGYCSLLPVDDEVWVSYYSAHESQKPSVYLVKIPKSSLGL